MLNKKALVVLAIQLAFAGGLYPAFNGLDYSARSFGMGSAFIAVGEDICSIQACPAGLANLKSWQVGMTYSRLSMGVADIGENYIAAACSLKDYGAVGLSWYSMGDPVYSETVYTLAYAYAALNSSFGVDIKYMTKGFASNEWTTANTAYFTALSKSVLSFGFSVQSQILKDISVALFMDDFNSPDVGISSEERLPVTLKGGLAYRMKDSTVALQLVSRANIMRFQGGVEATGFNLGDFGLMSFRLGSGVGTNYFNITGGLGVKFNIPGVGLGCSFDYGVMFPFNYAEGNVGTHKVSLTVTDMFRDIKKNVEGPGIN